MKTILLSLFKRSFFHIFLLIACFSFVSTYATENKLDTAKKHSETHTKKSKKEAHSKKSGFIDEALVDDEDDFLMEEPDPLEGLNRVTFQFNKVVDGLVLRPAAALYDTILNSTEKTVIRNVVDNAFSPLNAINHTLQGEGKSAVKTIFRFIVNSTIGLLGTMDAAEGMGVPKEQTSLNETFATWGIGTGPYLIIPILGPSSFRDASGKLGEVYMNPLYYYAHNKHMAHNRHGQRMMYLKVLYGLDAIDRRTQVIGGLQDLEKMSDDFYVGMRSVFFQQQEALAKRIKDRQSEEKPT